MLLLSPTFLSSMAPSVSSHSSIIKARPLPSLPSSSSPSPMAAAQHEIRRLSRILVLNHGLAKGRPSRGFYSTAGVRLLLNGWRWRRNSLSCGGAEFKGSNVLGGGSGGSSGRRGGGGGGDGNDDNEDNAFPPKQWKWGLFSAFSNGWQERVHADPQFPFKILTEEIIGVAASVFGDMACRPNFGLSELDFIFSNLIVCAIVNFALMYILAPTASASGAGTSLPGFFLRCPPGHMWEPGTYTHVQRAGTFVYKGAVFASVGFCAGLVGTALSTMLLNIRKKFDSSFCLQNAPPGTLLNACTWALQLGVSSNSRYQLLNGLEFGLEGAMNPSIFKGLVFAIRSLNNVVGGMSFMMMARLTGSQHTPAKRQEQAHRLLAVQS